MRAKLAFFVGVLMAIALVGCKKSHDLTGSWEIQDGNATATFDPGGTFTIAASKSGIDTTITGPYVLTDKALTMTNQDIKASTKTKELDSMVSKVQQAEEKTKGATATNLISWDGDDRFALFPNGSSLKGPHAVFVRKK